MREPRSKPFPAVGGSGWEAWAPTGQARCLRPPVPALAPALRRGDGTRPTGGHLDGLISLAASHLLVQIVAQPHAE